MLEATCKLQKDIDSINLWAVENKLSLNPEKTKAILIGSKPHLKALPYYPLLFLKNRPIHFQNSIKNLVENYSKGKNVEEPLDRDKLPIPNLPKDFLWMQVQGGSKMRNLLELALKEYGNGKDVLWTGSGAAIGKVISCAEILKRKFKDVHQFNKVQYRRCEEHWDPKLEGLDPLVVNRDVPMIHILLSHEAINADLPGYQNPNKENKPGGSGRQNRPKKATRPNISQQVENAGLGYNKGKPKKNVPKKEES